MDFNAYILDWTMNNYAQLKEKLTDSNFAYVEEGESEHIRVAVPFERIEMFALLCQTHINSPDSYVDIQYPKERKTVVIFQQEIFVISSKEENDKVKKWAIDLGLPPEQAEWATSY
jgi:hypothetical protein